jgi:KaiC/GvpD/RAD55 family RecA-like ATPase
VSPPIHIHLFRGLKTDTVGQVTSFDSRVELRKHLTEAGPYGSKEACPMFSAGIFDGPIAGRTPVEFTLVVGEHDAGTVPVDEAVERLKKAGIAAFIFTSASHTPEHPRWRVVAPLQRPIGSDQYLPLLGVLNGALCGCLAPESADLKRRWFYGRVEGAVEYRYGVAKGSRLLDDLAATEHGIESIEARPPKPTKVSSAPANTEPRTEHDISRAISALQTIPNSGEQRLPYDRWRDLAMALHAATGGHPRALDALIEWTADGQDEKTTAIWNGLRVDGGIGPGTLFKAAHDAGWNDPARVPSAEGLEAIDEPLDVGAEMIEGAAAREAGAAIEKAKTRFKSEPLAAFAQRPGIAWLIKHVLPRTGLAVIYGAPGSGKSFFALDMVATVARGSEWRGRKVRKGRAMYIAAEGSGGFASRGRAYLQAHGLTEIDLRVIGEAPNFFTGTGDEKHIAEEVRACGGADVIVIDTLSASSAGADENTGKDMNLIVGRMNKLQAATGALVVLVHHSGKDESKGARGWSGLKAAVDVEIEVSRPDDEEPGRVARITKQKDGESGAAFGFELEMVELGLDEDGDPIRSCVVKTTDQIPTKRARGAQVAADRRPRGQWKRMAFDFVEARGTVAFDEVVAKVAAEMPAPEPDKRDQRRGNARRDIDALIRGGFLEAIDEEKSLRLAGMGELL